MEALKASYGSDSDSDGASPDSSIPAISRYHAVNAVTEVAPDKRQSGNSHKTPLITPLPPPPVELFDLPSSTATSK